MEPQAGDTTLYWNINCMLQCTIRAISELSIFCAIVTNPHVLVPSVVSGVLGVSSFRPSLPMVAILCSIGVRTEIPSTKSMSGENFPRDGPLDSCAIYRLKRP